MWNPFEGLKGLEIFSLFSRPKRNEKEPFVGAHISGIGPDGNRIRTKREGKGLLPDAEGAFIHHLGEGATELDLTHADGEAVLIVRQGHRALLTADMRHVIVYNATPVNDSYRDSILAFELRKQRPVLIKIASGGTPIHRALQGFEITATR